MLKNKVWLLVLFIPVIFLTACNKVSGKFDGTWSETKIEPPMIVTIKSDGDHYLVHVEHFRNYIKKEGITKDLTAKELDEFTIKTVGEEWIIVIAKDGKNITFGGGAPLVKVS